MIFLLGRQAMFGQEPPTYFRSITTARFPSLANVQARYLPASPLPSTTRSYFSGLEIWSFIWIEVVGSNVRKLLSPWREISPAGSGLPNETQNKSIWSAKPAQERELQPFLRPGFGGKSFQPFLGLGDIPAIFCIGRFELFDLQPFSSGFLRLSHRIQGLRILGM